VQAIDRIAREPVEQAVAHHRGRTAKTFFGRLEDEVDRARKERVLGQNLGRAKQHGRVTIMAAAMHHAGDLRSVRQAGRLVHRQRIHVGAKADGAVAGARTQRADNAGTADAFFNFEPQLT
jgi:hypothetical protein